MASEKASGIRMIRPASKKTGMATISPVMPRAQAAFSSPNFLTMVTASVCAPPEASRMAPNIDPRPINRAMPCRVLPMPSLTALTISAAGIPPINPMAIAPIRMDTIACTLNLMIRTSRITRPAMAAKINLAGSSVTTSATLDTLLFHIPAQRMIHRTNTAIRP